MLGWKLVTLVDRLRRMSHDDTPGALVLAPCVNAHTIADKLAIQFLRYVHARSKISSTATLGRGKEIDMAWILLAFQPLSFSLSLDTAMQYHDPARLPSSPRHSISGESPHGRIPAPSFDNPKLAPQLRFVVYRVQLLVWEQAHRNARAIPNTEMTTVSVKISKRYNAAVGESSSVI